MNIVHGEQLDLSELDKSEELNERQRRLIEMIGKLRRTSEQIRGRSGVLDAAAMIMLQSAQMHAEELQVQEQQLPPIVDLPLPVPDDISAITHPEL